MPSLKHPAHHDAQYNIHYQMELERQHAQLVARQQFTKPKNDMTAVDLTLMGLMGIVVISVFSFEIILFLSL